MQITEQLADASKRPAVSRTDYERAERFLPWHARRLVSGGRVTPHWIAGSDRFWYRRRTLDGTEFVLVDPGRDAQAPAFDQDRLAASLARVTGNDHTADGLPFDAIELDTGGRVIQFDLGAVRWRCDLETYTCRKVHGYSRTTARELPSPDGRWAAFVRDHDLYVRSLTSGEERRLTDDGEPDHDYARATGVVATGVSSSDGGDLAVHALWSPDSMRLVTHRLDQRGVGRLALVQSVPPDGSARPRLYTYPYALPGDERVPLAQLVICDIEHGTRVEIASEPFTVPCHTLFEDRLVWWSADGTRIYFIREERGYQTAHLCVADAATGAVRTILTERGPTWVDTGPLQFWADPVVRVLSSGKILWWSERDGWGHLYLVDEASGRIERQVTRGAWQVQAITCVDESDGRLYFTAAGAEPGRNPYLHHLYRVPLAGGEPELLTPEDAHHEVLFSPSGRWFVDTYSRVDLPPVTVLRAADGTSVRTLEQADISALLAANWRPPERFHVRARDEVTDLYGVLVYPTTFDPSRRYPVLDDVYPGPHNIQAPLAFPDESNDFWYAQSLAELGFVVVMIDGMGTAFRSKAFHDKSYGSGFGEAGGLEDHISGLRQLAAERPWLDLERVGIYGHSGGGYAAARAILQYPDFYRVAVASSGNHDQRGYHPAWGERYVGACVDGRYDAQANAALAGNLRGRLLLAHGEMDDDVHPSMTLQLVDALVKANRDFDLLILPNANHAFRDLSLGPDARREQSPAWRYFLRRRWDYFVTHLLGADPPPGYAIRDPTEGGQSHQRDEGAERHDRSAQPDPS